MKAQNLEKGSYCIGTVPTFWLVICKTYYLGADADPDPAFHFDADPDPFPDPDPDPTFQFDAGWLVLTSGTIMYVFKKMEVISFPTFIC
jgi:hypothetical protein